MIAILLLSPTANAYEFLFSSVPGNSTTYHLESSSMNSTARGTVTDAFEAWDAGSGEVLRGAYWHVDVQTLSTNQSAGINNCRDEAYFRSDVFLQGFGFGGALAVTLDRICDDDVIFNTKYTWCTNGTPSSPSCRGAEAPSNYSTAYSLGQVAVHEFGHVIGFDHEDDYIATMNTFYPGGGDLGNGIPWEVNEDDAKGLTVLKPGTSTGFNISVSEWRHHTITKNGVTGGSARILFENDELLYRKGLKKWDPGPGKPRLIYHGTGSQTVRVEWRVSTNAICSSSDYLVGYRLPTMSANSPYVAGPYAWTFHNVPPGQYYLCVRVDPYDALNETLETDNMVVTRLPYVEVVP